MSLELLIDVKLLFVFLPILTLYFCDSNCIIFFFKAEIIDLD